MKRKEVIATLIEVSNDLDNMGLFKEADVLTRMAESFGNLHPTDFEFNPDNAATEHGFLGEMKYDAEQKAMHEMRNDDALMELENRINELKNNPAPTARDLHELDDLLEYRMSADFDQGNVRWPHKPNESQFVKELSDAGAKVIEPDLNDPFRDE